MSSGFPKSFWRTYTPRNIRNELLLRLRSLARSQVPPERLRRAPVYDDSHAVSVGRFYDSHHDQFMRVYGGVIQAFRTKNVSDLLNRQIRSIGFRPGQRALDAGCGVAVPAIHFAGNVDIRVDCITISSTQYEVATRNVVAANLTERVRVVQGDYHRLGDYFEKCAYDVVYLLESFGHSRAKARVLAACWEMLKPGGLLYIKDLFRRVPLRPEHARRIDREIRKINQAYRYEVGDLNAVLDALRGRGFILDSLQAAQLELEEFEDLAISNEFQELTGIARITDWGDYIFPVDFFEIKGIKPRFDPQERLDRHFLQTLLHPGVS